MFLVNFLNPVLEFKTNPKDLHKRHDFMLFGILHVGIEFVHLPEWLR